MQQRVTMEEVEVDESAETNWVDDQSGEELVRELLDDKAPPLFISPWVIEPEKDKDPYPRSESIINKLISTVYSGPTISDIESALSVNFHNRDHQGQSHASTTLVPPMFPLSDKSMGRIENKYTLRIKSKSSGSSGGGGLADDGYKWRKYGQKSIKNSPNPRSYYRCTNPRCNAKKQVERSTEDAETLVVTYEGLHLHYTYSHFLLSGSQDGSVANLHTTKKPKIIHTQSQQDQVPSTTPSSTPVTREHKKDHCQQGIAEDCVQVQRRPVISEKQQQWFLEQVEQSSQGLLEDIVPFLVRKPCTSTAASSSDPYSSSQVSSPSYTSTLSWPSNTPCLDVGIVSNRNTTNKLITM